MTTINSKAVRKEVMTMQMNSVNPPAAKSAPINKDKAVIIGFVLAMVSTLAVLSALGLIPKY